MKVSSLAKFMLIAGLIAYIGIAFGKIAGKHGKNPVLYGILSIVSPVNLILLGYWAFSGYESDGIKAR